MLLLCFRWLFKFPWKNMERLTRLSKNRLKAIMFSFEISGYDVLIVGNNFDWNEKKYSINFLLSQIQILQIETNNINLSQCTSIYLSILISSYLSLSVHIYSAYDVNLFIFIYLSIYLCESIYLSIYLSISVHIYLSLKSVHIYLYIYLRESIYLSITVNSYPYIYRS